MPKVTIRIRITTKKVTQMGDKTHHQDHVIYPVSLRPINKIVKSPTNPIPPVFVVCCDIINPPL
jgi:hypothetical protein